MPNINGKQYSYTISGIAQAKAAAKKKGKTFKYRK
jgi:hypothetical protein